MVLRAGHTTLSYKKNGINYQDKTFPFITDGNDDKVCVKC